MVQMADFLKKNHKSVVVVVVQMNISEIAQRGGWWGFAQMIHIGLRFFWYHFQL